MEGDLGIQSKYASETQPYTAAIPPYISLHLPVSAHISLWCASETQPSTCRRISASSSVRASGVRA